MKKLALILAITLISLQWISGQDAIREISSLEEIEAYQQITPENRFSLEDGADYFRETQICFVMDGWWYVLSYEPLVKNEYGRVGQRNAYLYKRKIGSEGGWVKASRNEVFQHSATDDGYVTFDPLQVRKGGTSRVQAVDVNGERVIALFVGLEISYYHTYHYLTRLILLRKVGVFPDGSTAFNMYGETLTKDKIFPMARIEGNVFYDTDGGKLSIISEPQRFGWEYSNSKGGGRSFITKTR